MLARHYYLGIENLKNEVPLKLQYKLFHYYEVLCKTDKWKELKPKTSKRKFGKDNSDDEPRAMGNKHAKLVQLNQKKSENVCEMIKKQQIYRTKLEERKVAALERSSENERLSVEMQAMMQDAGPGSQERREKYFKILQKTILKQALQAQKKQGT